MRLGFHGLLRPQEMFQLSVGDLAFPLPSRAEPLVLAIVDPKNRAFLGRRQFRVVHDPGTIAWARWLVDGWPRFARLWPGSAASFRQVWNWGLAQLQLTTLQLTPGCLRPGGATHLFRTGTPVASIKYRGSWASEKSLSVYIQEAMASFVWQFVPESVQRELADKIERDSLLLVTAPPVPWRSLYQRRPPAPPPKRSSSQQAPPIDSLENLERGALMAARWRSSSPKTRRS